MALPLEGVVIIDLSWIIAGPFAARLLSDFGADVVKVESRRRMDIGRANRVPLFGVLPDDANSNPDTGGYFQDANAGKRSVTLNLESEAGRGLLRRLVSRADVTVCNLAGDQYERWGIGYEVMRAINPRIIMVNMPSMESSGPRKAWRGFGDMFTGLGGLKSVSGHEGEPPLPWGHQYADFSSNPFHAAIAIMAALVHRDRTGEGQFIEVSQYESTVALVGPAIIEYGLTGVSPAPVGNRDRHAVPHNFYRCAGDDSWCAIAVETDEQWMALVAAAPEANLDRAEWRTAAGRRQDESSVDTAIESWTRGRERQALAAALQEQGVPAGPFQHIDEMIHADPTLGDAHFATLLQATSGREFLVHRNPLRARHHPPETRLAPLIGEHTYEVLTDLMGLSADEVAEYAAQGALE